MAASDKAAIKAEVDASVTRFRINEAGIRDLITGPITKDLVRRAILVQNAAKLNARHPPPSVPGSGPAVRTGRLWQSITWRLGVDPVSPYVDIGTNIYYAPFLELGTKFMGARPFLAPALQAARADF